MPKKMKSNNPPRRVEIRGQDHLLAYITPAEAQLLMDNGGSGEPGPMGIPAFDMGEGQGGDGFGGDMGGDDGGGGGGPTGGRGGGRASAGMDTSRGSDYGGGGRMEDADARVAAAVAAQEAADRGIDAETDDPTTAGRGSTEYDPDVSVFGTPEAERNWVERSLISRLQDKGLKGFVGLERDAKGRVTGYTTQANPFGSLGLLTSIFDINPTVYTGFGEGAGFGDGPEGDGPAREIVPTQTNPVTGQEECPSGYTFDGEINACRIDAPLANVGDTVGGTGFDYQPGTYARMGLLDVAPEGLPQFAERYGTGFMTPEEFEAANLDYRRRAGTMAGIFQDPYNLQGYTLLS